MSDTKLLRNIAATMLCLNGLVPFFVSAAVQLDLGGRSSVSATDARQGAGMAFIVAQIFITPFFIGALLSFISGMKRNSRSLLIASCMISLGPLVFVLAMLLGVGA